jgi:hypothetical protein
VLIALGLTDYQNVLEMDFFPMRRRWERRIYGRLILSAGQANQKQGKREK